MNFLIFIVYLIIGLIVNLVLGDVYDMMKADPEFRNYDETSIEIGIGVVMFLVMAFWPFILIGFGVNYAMEHFNK